MRKQLGVRALVRGWSTAAVAAAAMMPAGMVRAGDDATDCPPPPPPPACSARTSITSNFNGTRVPGGDYIWFNSVLKVAGLPSKPVTIRMTHATITFTANGQNYTVWLPDAQVTFDSTVTQATTTYDASANSWITRTRPGLAGNTFLSGYPWLVNQTLPGGTNPVTWQGEIDSDTPGVKVNWQWAAAAYSSFSSYPDTLGVKPVDDNKGSQYANSDHAGTPEAFKTYVVGGARGGGGANATGSYSGTGHADCG
ncbi:MAG TPA: hypothetical protein VHE37_10945 [Nevskiaceae bacterium]|nr:hypothetical protein [Nevskiaceae bacterium]